LTTIPIGIINDTDRYRLEQEMVEGVIGVFGANGHTGRFVAAELARRGLAARWIGRDLSSLLSLRDTLNHGEVRLADIDDAQSLLAAFSGLDVVINCAGPFLDTSRPVVSAALRAGAHALDITAEQAAILDTITNFDADAKRTGLTIVPGMAFFGGLGDLLATSALEGWGDVDAIDLAVALSSWHPTLGTRRTGERNIATRVVVRGDALVPAPAVPPISEWRFPDPFGLLSVTCVPLSEIVLLARHVRASAITSYMNARPLADLADRSTPPPRGSDALGRSDQMFAVSVRARRGGEVREKTLGGRDIYAVTAPLVVEASVRLLERARPEWAGVRAPGEIFPAGEFIASLSHVLHPQIVCDRPSTDQRPR
jgi:hypothetical protein